MRRILLVTLHCLLALATSASADCAWVLWSQPYTRSPGARAGLGIASGRWALQIAYPSVAECTDAIDLRAAFARKNRYRVVRDTSTKLFLMEETAQEGAEWQCLPDTVDPRAPKGK